MRAVWRKKHVQSGIGRAIANARLFLSGICLQKDKAYRTGCEEAVPLLEE